MDGRERAIILGLYLTGVATYLAIVGYKFAVGVLDFDSFKAEYLGAAGLLLALLIKLPPTQKEAEATAQAAVNGPTAETVEVTGEEVTVKKGR
jgi:hypothetical protein